MISGLHAFWMLKCNAYWISLSTIFISKLQIKFSTVAVRAQRAATWENTCKIGRHLHQVVNTCAAWDANMQMHCKIHKTLYIRETCCVSRGHCSAEHGWDTLVATVCDLICIICIMLHGWWRNGLPYPSDWVTQIFLPLTLTPPGRVGCVVLSPS